MKNEDNKVLFIVNPYAGTGYRPDALKKITQACKHHNIDCTIALTESRGHAAALARQGAAKNEYKQIIAAGGDGTVNEVARGLLHSQTPMGIIPRGSGNGLARHLGIPMKLPEALETLFRSRVIQMDTFEMNGELSVNVSGIGFDAHIANLFAVEKKRGFSGYAKLTLSEFIRFREFEVEIGTENITMTRKAFVIAIANSSQYGNNARIAPAASVSDALLHISLLKKIPPYRFDVIYALFNGTLDRSDCCEVFTTDRLLIRVNQFIPFHVDGEPCGASDRFDIAILPGSIKMLVPKHRADL